MNKKKINYWLFWGVITIALVFLDQYTKFLAVSNLKGSKPFVIWDGVFELCYVENTGAAYGVFSGKLFLFIMITFIVMPIIVLGIRRINNMISFFGEKINIKAMRFLQADMFFLLAGAIGNLIDRVVNNYVVDFLYFKLIDFPVFNIADCYITVAAVAFIIVGLLFLKNDELDYLTSSKKKWQVKDESK